MEIVAYFALTAALNAHLFRLEFPVVADAPGEVARDAPSVSNGAVFRPPSYSYAATAGPGRLKSQSA